MEGGRGVEVGNVSSVLVVKDHEDHWACNMGYSVGNEVLKTLP